MRKTLLLFLLFLSNLIVGQRNSVMKKLLTFFITMYALSAWGQVQQKNEPADFLPKGYIVFEKINGDLNKDGIADCVFVIKGTDPNRIVDVPYRGKLDRNRRGILILFNKKDHYELALENDTCFSSENEDGGVYFPPKLYLEISNGNLYINYGHGRYGHWKYIFRYQHSYFELIGYEESNGGVVTDSETSINFQTKKKREKINTNENAEGGDEVFKEIWKDIQIDKLIKLNEVRDFDNLDFDEY